MSSTSSTTSSSTPASAPASPPVTISRRGIHFTTPDGRRYVMTPPPPPGRSRRPGLRPAGPERRTQFLNVTPTSGLNYNSITYANDNLLHPPITINPNTPAAVTLITPLAEEDINQHFQHLAWTPPTPPILHEAQDPEDFDLEAMQEEFAAEEIEFPDEDEPTGVPLDINPQNQDWMPPGSEICPQCQFPTLNGELCVFCREDAALNVLIQESKTRYNQLLADIKIEKATLRAALKRKYEGIPVDIDLTQED